ncbi:MAG TPA: HdeD family acid-resistance protein [Candidatus Limnocylindrales bacterium]|nr:HdeD family acid-resistance protein [Candidatus Limnocylindrales bacterium]
MSSGVLLFGLETLRRKWGWFLALGIVMVCLGALALAMTPVATFAAVMVLGWLMVASGVVEMVHGFSLHRWGGMFLHLIGGIVGVLVGLLVVTHPVAGAFGWTLLFASFLTVIGLFRIVGALSLRFANWGWAVFDGCITLGLGILVWAGWPWSGLWFLGVCLGLTLLLRGWSYIMLAFAVRSIRPSAPEIVRAA